MSIIVENITKLNLVRAASIATNNQTQLIGNYQMNRIEKLKIIKI